MLVAALALAAFLVLAVFATGLYLVHIAHGVRREADRALQRTLAEHTAERRDWANRLMHLADRPWEPPPIAVERPRAEPDLFEGIDENVESSFDEEFVAAPSGSL